MKKYVHCPIYAFYYAKYILKDKYPEGEAAIAKIPSYTYFYARDILKDRFVLGEDSFTNGSTYGEAYFKLYEKDILK